MQSDLSTLLNAGKSLNVVGEAALVNSFSAVTLVSASDPAVPSAPPQSMKVKSTNS
jgi:hypothetical protein